MKNNEILTIMKDKLETYLTDYADCLCISFNENKERVEAFLTPSKLRAYRAGTLPWDAAVDAAVVRKITQTRKKYTSQLHAVMDGADADRITVRVTYTRAGVCRGTARAGACAYTARAGGWGYDKSSTVLAEIFNQIPAVMRRLYACDARNVLGCDIAARRAAIGYGSSRGGPMPAIDGGIGDRAVFNILTKIGAEVETVRLDQHGDDVLHIVTFGGGTND